MAARVTAAEVKSIMDSITQDDPVIESFIAAGDNLVTDILGSAALSETSLKEITRWLTAHMICTTLERLGSDEKAGSASTKYNGEYRQNLSASPYGQMVLLLDTTGLLLAASAGKLPASIYAVPSFE